MTLFIFSPEKLSIINMIMQELRITLHDFFDLKYCSPRDWLMVKISLARLEFFHEYEARHETGRVLRFLGCFPNGIRKQDFEYEFFPHLVQGFFREDSLKRACRNLIRRVKHRSSFFGVNVVYEDGEEVLRLNPCKEFFSLSRRGRKKKQEQKLLVDAEAVDTLAKLKA